MRLANLGYLGHMWELYTMWTWVPLFLAVSFATAEPPACLTFRAGPGMMPRAWMHI